MRLLARVYAGGPTPSKVMGDLCFLGWRPAADLIIVVVKFHEAEIHGQIVMIESLKLATVVAKAVKICAFWLHMTGKFITLFRLLQGFLSLPLQKPAVVKRPSYYHHPTSVACTCPLLPSCLLLVELW